MKKTKKPIVSLKKGEKSLGAGVGSQFLNDKRIKEMISKAKKTKSRK